MTTLAGSLLIPTVGTKIETLILEDFTISDVNGTKVVRFRIPNRFVPQIENLLMEIPEEGPLAGSSTSTAQYQGQGDQIRRVSIGYERGDTFTSVELTLISDLNDVQLKSEVESLLSITNLDIIAQRVLVIKSINMEGTTFAVSIVNATAYNMARFREMILEDVPTMAVESVTIYENRTAWEDASLFQMISSLVFNSENLVEGGVRYRIDVKGEPGQVRRVTGRDLEPVGETYGVVPVEYNIPDGEGGTITLPQSILKLLPAHSMNVECIVTIGNQKRDARWGCVTNLTFDQLPDRSGYILKGVVRGNLTIERIIEYLMGVINQTEDLKLVSDL